MRPITVLLALGALTVFGTAHGSGQEPTNLVITTHNPACTAVFLSSYNVTRQSDLLYNYEYGPGDFTDGINMTFAAHAGEGPGLVDLLADREEVSGVVLYSADTPPDIIEQVTKPVGYVYGYIGGRPCEIPKLLLQNAVGSLRDVDSAPYRNLVGVNIYTENVADTLAYITENGGVVSLVAENKDDISGEVQARVPVPLLMNLSRADHVIRVAELGVAVMPARSYGSVYTEGNIGMGADAWSGGHNGANVRIGVIDSGFAGFDATGELPYDTQFFCFNSVNGPGSETDASSCYGGTARGTAAAEIFMDMAPGATLHISRVHDDTQAKEAIDRMAHRGVNVVSMPPAIFFGGAGGTDVSALNTIDYMVDNGMVWIDVVGDYGYGGDWSAWDPPMHDNLVVFDISANDTTNRFEANAGEPVYVWLRWHDADNNNADLNLLVSDGTRHYTGVTDQWGGGPTLPVESVAFVPPDDGHYDISIAAIGAAIPDRVQLFVSGVNGGLEHTGGGASPGATYERYQDRALASLVATTHNPGCTTVFLSSYNVTRQSDLLYNYKYSDDSYINGISMTYTAYADEASKLVDLLAARGEVTKVVAYSADEPPRLLAQISNPDVRIVYLGFATCEIHEMLLQDAVDALRAADSIQSDSLVGVGIYTDNLAETLAYLERSGGVVNLAVASYEGAGGGIHASVPVPLLMVLLDEDHITHIKALRNEVMLHD